MRQDILATRFVWFSHGHPDHMNPKSLPRFKGKRILVGDHVGGRLSTDLRRMGFDVTILPDRRWMPLSEHVKVLCITTLAQDSLLLVDVGGRLFVNLNDAGTRGCTRFVRTIASSYEHSYLLTLSGWGDVDMFNLYDEDGQFIETILPGTFEVGAFLSLTAKSLRIGHVIPFSSFHRYQRTDTVWAEKYVTALDDYAVGFDHDDLVYIPPFSTVDCGNGAVLTHDVVVPDPVVHSPEEFGDDWSETLDGDDRRALEAYFATKAKVQSTYGFLRFRVGGQDTVLHGRGPSGRGITFEVPRASLMTSVRHRIFDDLLIGNFMKTTLHGGIKSLYEPNFNFWVTKYADNGLVESDAEVAAYLREYRRRAGIDYYRTVVGDRLARVVRERFEPLRHTRPYAAAKKLYYTILK